MYILINSFTSQVDFSHISGHQDRGNKELSTKEKLNIIVDARAKVALWEYIISGKPAIDLIGDKEILGGLKIRSQYLQTDIVSNIRKTLLEQIAKIRAINYWVEKGKSFLVDKDADLGTFHHAANNIPINLKRWLLKWSCGICGVGK